MPPFPGPSVDSFPARMLYSSVTGGDGHEARDRIDSPGGRGPGQLLDAAGGILGEVELV